MANLIVVLIILTILGGASYKLYWNKKHNIKCSGCSSCPSNGKCQGEELKK